MSASSPVIESRPLLAMNPEEGHKKSQDAEEGLEPSNTDVIHDDRAIWDNREAYGPAGFEGLFASPFVFACAAFTALGGLLFGYE